MKKVLLFLLCLMLSMPCALSETAYPACQGTVTDLANVLGSSTAQDLETLSARYESITGGKLYVITRHFLGGKDVKAYTRALFDAWQLSENDILFMMVIGEESYALCAGREAEKALPDEMAATYLSSYFHTDYIARRYDEAAAALCTQALTRITSAGGGTLSSAGLFGTAAEAKSPSDFVQDLNSMFSTLLTEDEDDHQEHEQSILKEDQSSGISIWKIILFIVILRTIFGQKKKRRFNFGHHPRR